MEPTLELTHDLYAEKVRRARLTPLEQKLTAGPMLFSYTYEAARAGIRALHPHASAAEVDTLLQQRLALQERLEKSAWTQME
jgi:hypothetical protein